MNTAFKQGRDAYWRGAYLNDNPYAHVSNDHSEWARGWWFAHDEHEKGGER